MCRDEVIQLLFKTAYKMSGRNTDKIRGDFACKYIRRSNIKSLSSKEKREDNYNINDSSFIKDKTQCWAA